jgi:hypothetical protein
VQPHRAAGRRKQHRDRHLGVAAQCLLGLGALAPDARDGGQHGRIGVVELREGVGHALEDVFEHGLVEVDAAEPFETLRPADQPEVDVALAHDRGVERAATEVVDRDRGPGAHPLVRGVGHGRRLGLGQERDGEALVRERGGQQLLLVLSPCRGVGDRDPVGGAALALGDAVDHPADEPRGQVLRRPRPACDHHGRRIADAPLELPDHAVRVGQGPALCGVADHDGAVRPDEDHRRHRGPAATQGDDFWFSPAAIRGATHRCAGERRPQVDPELVRHGLSPHPDNRPAGRSHPRIAGTRPVVSPLQWPYWTKAHPRVPLSGSPLIPRSAASHNCGGSPMAEQPLSPTFCSTRPTQPQTRNPDGIPNT